MLRKIFERVFVPGTQEQPAIEGGYYCYSQPPPGRWETRCSVVDFPVNGSHPVPPGTTINVDRDAEGNITRVYALVCAVVWIADGPPGPPTCVTIEPQPYQPGTVSRVDFLPMAGWDSGANSVQSRDGDCEVVWQMGLIVGGYVGFTVESSDIADPSRYTHSIYFHQLSGRPVFRLVEEGVTVSHDAEYSLEDEFIIRRVGGRVTYWRNGQKIQDSDETSGGEIIVGSSLYLSGDTVP